MTALELLQDIVTKVQAESTKYQNGTITLTVCKENCVNIANTINSSISGLSSEEQSSTILNDVNQVKDFIIDNYS